MAASAPAPDAYNDVPLQNLQPGRRDSIAADNAPNEEEQPTPRPFSHLNPCVRFEDGENGENNEILMLWV